MRRRFNQSEKTALYLAAGGRCVQCGTELVPGWHGDHVTAYALGGETDVLNGQALCPKCNYEKGATSVMNLQPWPQEKTLRTWQETAVRHVLTQQSSTKNFLTVATPGAGKTVFALRVSHTLLMKGIADRLIIVVPSRNLKTQWQLAATKVGIHLHPQWEVNEGLSDYHGVVVTYQQVASNPDLIRMLCSRPTFVIFDEIHHAGDKNSWGAAVMHAFERAVFRLLISGTPFRSDKSFIPYVNYENGRSKADFSYSYGQALDDGICRSVYFPTIEGEMVWMTMDGERRATFNDDLEEQAASERLRTALDPQSQWMKDTLKEGHRKLLEIRENGHRDAGGLVTAIDQQHAQAIVKLLQSITREEIPLVISDEPDAQQHIEDFKTNRKPWLVSVRMVSEGVDIPRLRVGMYLTNIASELFFRQFVGRFVRLIEMTDEDDQYAAIYLPAERVLLQYAKDIQNEREHHVTLESERLKRELQGERQEQPRLFVPIAATPQEHETIFVNGISLTPQDLSEAERIIQRLGKKLSAIDIALAVKYANEGKETPPHQYETPYTETPIPLFDQKMRLRKSINSRASRLAYLRGATKETIGDYLNAINTTYGTRTGIWNNKADASQLLHKLQWIEECIKEEIRHGE